MYCLLAVAESKHAIPAYRLTGTPVEEYQSEAVTFKKK
jgi:hypothetical protein